MSDKINFIKFYDWVIIKSEIKSIIKGKAEDGKMFLTIKMLDDHSYKMTYDVDSGGYNYTFNRDFSKLCDELGVLDIEKHDSLESLRNWICGLSDNIRDLTKINKQQLHWIKKVLKKIGENQND